MARLSMQELRSLPPGARGAKNLRQDLLVIQDAALDANAPLEQVQEITLFLVGSVGAIAHNRDESDAMLNEALETISEREGLLRAGNNAQRLAPDARERVQDTAWGRRQETKIANAWAQAVAIDFGQWMGWRDEWRWVGDELGDDDVWSLDVVDTDGTIVSSTLATLPEIVDVMQPTPKHTWIYAGDAYLEATRLGWERAGGSPPLIDLWPDYAFDK